MALRKNRKKIFFFWGHFSQSGFVNFDMFTEFAYHTRQIYLYKAKPELK